MGVFDGVHRGHRFLIDSMIDKAHDTLSGSAVITFDIDPEQYLHPNGYKKIMRDSTRIDILDRSGVDRVYVLDFQDIRKLGPYEFLDMLFQRNIPRSINVGFDIRFGYRAEGSVENMVEWADGLGVEIDSYDLMTAGDDPITSTRIKHVLIEGGLGLAEELLGHRYFIDGHVEHGRGEGSGFGIATANLRLEESLRLLEDGVYTGIAYVDGETYRAVASIGISPTFENRTDSNAEIHILDHNADLYGSYIRFEVISYIRPLLRFDDSDELISAIERDIERAKSIRI